MSAPAGESPAVANHARAIEWLRVAAIAIAALAVVGGAVWLLSLAFASATPPRPPARTPFGVPAREMAPSGGAIASWLLIMQGQFYQALTGAVRAMRDAGAAPTGLVWIGFLYGVFHAAGPGHGKAVVAGYVVANETALARGVAISFAAAALQATVAITLVAVVSVALGATARQMDSATRFVEIGAFAAMAALGAWLLWTKSRRLAMLLSPSPIYDANGQVCGHMHAPPPEILSGAASWRAWIAIVIAAGARPCSGAIILLVFALAQGLFGAGVVGVIAMGLGTALTTSALAALAVFFKQTAVRYASGGGRGALLFIAIGETLAGALILVFGAAFVLGLWANGGN